MKFLKSLFKKSPKPIFIIKFPKTVGIKDMEEAVENFYEKFGNQLKKDYYILVCKDIVNEEFKFECFNSQITEIEFEELQKRVLEIIKDNDKTEL